MLIDTHCHIYNEYYDNIDLLMDKLKSNNIKFVINNACNLDSCKEVIELSKKYDSMYFTLGLHPEENLSEINDVMHLIRDNVSNNKFLGIGEIGLDYYYSKDNKDLQIDIFESQLKLAEELNLPVIIHSREATGDMLNILRKYNLKGIIHCFNGSVETAKEYIKMGFKLGVNGVITFKNCKLIDVYKEIGINNIVFETDSPYLTPVPYRGLKNDSSYINNIVDFIINNIDISRDELINVVNNNVKDIFDI